MRSVEGIRTIIESTGWEISYLHEAHTPFAFVHRDQLLHWMMGTTTANWDIPKSIAPSFFNRLIDHMIEIEPTIRDESEVYHFHLSRVHVVAHRIVD